MRAERGFTLIEVLVALAILAIALGALVRAGTGEIRAQARINELQAGLTVAQNLLSELRLTEGFPEPGRREGQSDLGAIRLRYRVTIGPTADPTVRRADVQIFLAQDDAKSIDDAPITTLSGFYARPR